MSAFHKSCALACLLALGCASAEDPGKDPFNPGTDTDMDPSDAVDSGGGSNGEQSGGQNTPGGKDAGSANGSKDAGMKADAGSKGDAGMKADAGTKPDAGMPPVGTGGVSLPPPALEASCMGKVQPSVTSKLPTFKRETLVARPGAAYLHPVDMNGDKFPEFLLTSLSEAVDFAGGVPPLDFGGAYLLRREGGAPTGTVGKWQSQVGFDKSARIGCPNASELFDADGDNINDWVIGAGFLLKPIAKVVWMKGTAAGTFGAPKDLIPEPKDKCWFHSTLPLDMDGDKDNDFVTSCHIGDVNTAATGASRVEWYENDGKGVYKLHAVGPGGGSLISLYDLDGDGDQDIVAPQFFGPESMIWYEQTGAKGATWAKHVINNTSGKGFIVKFADMNGDGKTDMLYGNHNNEASTVAAEKIMGLYWFDLPETDKVRGLTNWDAYKHTIYEGFSVEGTDNANQAGAPGMINVGDIDGDCDLDVTASGDGDLGLYVFVQQKDNKFEKVEISREPGNLNSGEQHLADLDGDGDLDIVWAVFGRQPPIGFSLDLESKVYGFLQQ